jgi:hypothetical protein
MTSILLSYARFTANVSFDEFHQLLFAELPDEGANSQYLEQKYVEMQRSPTFLCHLDETRVRKLEAYLTRETSR